MRYQFADYILDTQQLTLEHAGHVASMRPKVFQLLFYLIAHCDRVVPKDELCAQVWPEQFVSDSTLGSTLRAVRRAIGDTGDTQQLILTYRGQGYRFVAEVEAISEAVATVTEMPRTCAACRHANPAAAQFCMGCGVALEETCPGCGKAFTQPATYCSACGQKLSESARQIPVNESVAIDLILHTKLHRPRVSKALIQRPRLFAQLTQGLRRKMTLTVAPAGFGKSILISEWLSHVQMEGRSGTYIAWLSLDAYDNDVAVFLRYLVAAIRTAVPDACLHTSRLLRSPRLPPDDYLVTLLIHDLSDLPQGQLIFVLDDYHLIEAKGIHQFLTRLIVHQPRHVHMVLISRVDPPLPLARLQLQGEISEMRADALSFSQVETQAFLQQTLGRSVVPETVKKLYEQTEGWAVGLQLAALSLQRVADDDAFVHDFKGINRHMTTYLLEEVLNQQPAEVQDFLLQTSILDRFCEPLCQAVCEGRPDAARPPSIWSHLEKANLFVVALDDEGYWYRYHHLFQTWLRHKLQSHLDKDGIANLQRRASVWFCREGLIEDALRYALASGDAAAAADLVEQQRHRLIDDQDYQTLTRWMGLLPNALVQERPALLLIQAWMAHLQQQSDAIAPLILQAEVELERQAQLLDATTHHVLEGEIDLLWATVYYWRGEGQKMLTHAQRALKHVPPAHTFFYSTIRMGVGWGYQMMGEPAQAIAFLQAALERDARSQDPVFQARMLHSIGLVLFRSGDLTACHAPLQRLIEMAEANRFILDFAWAHCCLGRVCYEQNRLIEAIDHFSSAADYLQPTSLLTVLQANIFGLALTYQALDQPDEAQAALDRLRDLLSGWKSKAILDETDAFQARLFLLQGRTNAAVRQIETLDTHMPERLGDRTELLPLIQVRCLLAQGGETHLRAAHHMLQAVWLVVKNVNHCGLMIETLVLEVLVQAELEQVEAALQGLQQAVELAQPGGFIRSFVDMGRPMARLLTQLVARGVETDYLGRVLAAFENMPDIGEPG